MFAKLAILFIVMPILEIALLIKVGEIISFWPTIAIIITTGVVGAWLARLQGRRALAAMRLSLARGELPGNALLDGILVLVAGVVLVTPGLITDVIGLALLVPPIRAVVRRSIKRRIRRRIESEGGWATYTVTAGPTHWEDPFAPDDDVPYGSKGYDEVIEGEIIDVVPEAN